MLKLQPLFGRGQPLRVVRSRAYLLGLRNLGLDLDLLNLSLRHDLGRISLS